MKDIIINDEKLIIRRADGSDAKAVIDYINVIAGESDFLTFGIGEFESGVEEEVEFIKGTLKKENALFIIAEVENKVVGCLNFSGGERKRTAHVGDFGVSVLKEYWGYSVGTELIQYLIDWSRDTGIIRKINLKVRPDNARGIYLYKKLGFIEEGVKSREFLINGEFYDSLLMGLVID